MCNSTEIACYRGFRHAGIVVANLERSAIFYSEIFGFSEWKRQQEQGSYIEAVVGVPGAVLEWAKLKGTDGLLLELIQYKAPPCEDKLPPFLPTNRVGGVHLALTVVDATDVYNRLRQYGCVCHSEPQLSPDGKVLVFYGRDPDGVILEVVEELSF